MADNTQIDSRPSLITKDLQGSDGSVPLSPQWLLPKAGENKTGGAFSGDSPQGHVNRQDSMKSAGTVGDFNESNKKKDVFRPSVLNMESNHRDRWRDEERDTNINIRKERWRDGEKEQHHENQRLDRRVDSSGGRPYSEARRAPVERRNDLGNKDSHDQRRESKWSTRWGPDEKNVDTANEKWGDSKRDADAFLDKGASPYRVKDDGDGDVYRPRRANSSYSRGRTDPHNQTPNQSKHGPTFSHGRGRGENPAPTFSLSAGKVGHGGSTVIHTATDSQPHASVFERVEPDDGELARLKYNRTKLLDIYRGTNGRSIGKYFEGMVQVPLFAQEVLEPLALSEPSVEELVILEGIDKGEITSSGAQQIIKEGATGWPSNDSMHSRRSALGKADLPVSLDDSKLEAVGGSKFAPSDWPSANVVKPENQATAYHKPSVKALGEDNAIYTVSDGISDPNPSGSSRISSSFLEHTNDWRDIAEKDSNSWENSAMTIETRKGPRWQVDDDPIMRKQSSAVFERDVGSKNISQQSPEELVLYYKDPQGEVQGPFSGSDIIAWFEAGYFGIDLQVRLVSAPSDTPFSLLGDVMPHLRAKARPPPGFSTPKQNEIQGLPGVLNYGNINQLHAVSNDIDLKNDSIYEHGSKTVAENRFLESLMAGTTNVASLDQFARAEGFPGYSGHNSNPTAPLGPSIGDDPFLLPKSSVLDRQASLPKQNQFWLGRDAQSVAAKSDATNNASFIQSKLLPSVIDNPRLLQHSHGLGSVSAFQGLSDLSTSTGTANTGISGWPNIPVQGGLDMHQNPSFPPESTFGVQNRLQPQSPLLTNLFAQSMDNNIPNMLSPEMLLAASGSQDPQLSLLQQQYLLQLQSQSPTASHQQLSILEKMLLLKQQQQKQEEQQLLMRQQLLLSQVLSGRSNNQQLGMPSLTQLQPSGFIAGNSNLDHTRFHQAADLFQKDLQLQTQSVQTGMGGAAGFVSMPSDSKNISPLIGSDASLYPPHQVIGNDSVQKVWNTPMTDQMAEQNIGSSFMGEVEMPEKQNQYVVDQMPNFDEPVKDPIGHIAPSVPLGKDLGLLDSQNSTVGHEKIPILQDDVNTPETAEASVEDSYDSSSAKEVKIPKPDVKKSSEKKSKKQKSSKVTADLVSRVNNSQLSKSLESEDANSVNAKSQIQQDIIAPSQLEKEKKTENVAPVDVSFSHADNSGETNIPTDTGKRVWKPAPGFKPKSLLEIQQEEQRRAREEKAVSDIAMPISSMSISTPWAGIAVNAGKGSSEPQQDGAVSELNFPKASHSSSVVEKKNSQEDDLFWGDDSSYVVPSMGSQTDSVTNDDFIDAKDTKKSRKKSKAKNAAAKVASAASVSTSVVPTSTIEKSKPTRQVQQEEVVFTAPSGPSLGDFVMWKEESSSQSPAPAWSTDARKQQKPTSLRDILKEQEKKSSSSQPVPMPTQRTSTTQMARGTGPLRQLSSSPVTAANPVPSNLQAAGTNSKHKVEADLFWGPMEPETKQSEFPQLGTQVSVGTKSGTPAKGKSAASASAAQSSMKGTTTYSEAMDFKEWCEKECMRLNGSKDTSILEYCLKLSKTEAETLLVENLGSSNHGFIDQFLNYKDFLPADALEVAFKNRNNRLATPIDMTTEHMDSVRIDASDGTAKTGGKKKGKKGKKVSPSVLGFNVVSNRIMKGEIQTIDD